MIAFQKTEYRQLCQAKRNTGTGECYFYNSLTRAHLISYANNNHDEILHCKNNNNNNIKVKAVKIKNFIASPTNDYMEIQMFHKKITISTIW